MRELLNNSLILGLGKTGLSLLNFLIKNGASNVYTWDDNLNKRNSVENILDWKNIKRVFVSPGVPINYPEPHHLIRLAIENGCSLTNDVSLFCELYKSKKLIGITGTNGKSTVTKMVSDLLTDKGRKAACIGNIGTPVFSLDHPYYDFFCIELSSFQLELFSDIRLSIGILLDITPDHMDRYRSFEDYAKAKSNIFNNPETIAIISVNNSVNRQILATLKNRVIVPISTERILEHGFSMIEDKIYENGVQIDSVVTRYKNHNENILASYVCARLLGENNYKESIEEYIPIPHRLEFVVKYKNITIINDSKATNAESAKQALSLYDRIYWIAGGKIKKGNQLEAIDTKNVRKAFFFGESKNLLFEIFEGKIPCEICENLDDAFLKSLAIATRDENNVTILFSPAHSSFDEFQNFEHRGDYFKSIAEINDR